jgi:hypothetical protein
LRHISHSFTVEVKRHRGRQSAADNKQILNLGLAEAVRKIEAESDKTSALAFSPRFHPDDNDAPKTPAGRVLPSLIESAQWTFPSDGSEMRSPVDEGGPLEVEAAKKQKGSRRHRRPILSDQSAVRDSIAAPSDSGASDEPSWEAILSASGARVKKTAVRRRKIAPPARPDPSLKSLIDEIPQSLDDLQSYSLSAPASQDAPDLEVRSGRRRKILARYVFGTEPKLGERWKRRFRKLR